MMLTTKNKNSLKRELARCLAPDNEIRRIVVFGSFLSSSEPNDMDVAIFQDSEESYLPLAMKYRRQTRPVAHRIPLDIIPIKNDAAQTPFLNEIEAGETIYER